MSDSLYKLRCNVVGHEKDVRSLCRGSDFKEVFVSGSRDVTGRVWTSNGTNNGFSEGNILSGHSGFVAAVCVLPPNEEHPDGLIVTASNDRMIHIYSFDSPLPLLRLEGHTDTVCSLALGKHGTLLSGSWDKTAKVWLKDKNLMTLSGHELAVWCVAVMPEGGYMLTGSADKLIKVWKAGRCEQTLRGHDDCVRGLVPLNSEEFLSCSNDSSIRRWSLTAGVLQVYYSHMNYVYSIAAFPNSTDFVSVSEDRSLKIWRNGDCVQTISHPTTSVWSVCVLHNGDIVTGSSDGVIRVFTNCGDRMASSEEIKAFEEQVSATEIPTQVGDIDSSKLPGSEALFAPGKKDGAVQMIKVGTKVEAHQWSAAEQKWSKVGDVVGSSGGQSTGKTLHEGKEYDFVFSVDIAEGQPPLKLPYNMTEDPWVAAQRFLTKHGLDQAFLEQVRDFIVQNSQSVSMSQQTADSNYRDPFTGGSSYVPGPSGPASSGSGYADPFTGGARYVPSGAGGSSAGSVPSQGADPFTGGGSYRPAEATKQPVTNEFFPLNMVVTFNKVTVEAVIKKLKGLNAFLKGSQQCVEGDLDVAAELCNIDKDPTMPMLAYLWRLLQWPKEHVFPCIDTLRVALRNRVTNEHFCSDQRGPEVLALLVRYISTEQTIINQTVALRAISNLPAHSAGHNLLLANCENIIPLVVACSKSRDKNLQTAVATVLMNTAVILKPTAQAETKSTLITAMIAMDANLVHDDAKFRLCCGLGTLIWKDEECAAVANSLDVMTMVRKWNKRTEEGKLENCAKHVAECLS